MWTSSCFRKSSFEGIIHEHPLVNMYLSRLLSHRLIKAKSPLLDALLPFAYSVIGSEKKVGTTTFIREVAEILSSEVKKEGPGRRPGGRREKGRLGSYLEFAFPIRNFWTRSIPVIGNSSASAGFTILQDMSSFHPPLLNSKERFPISGYAFRLFLGILREKFDYIIFDLPPLLQPLSRKVLRLSDRVLYVMADTPEGIEAAKEEADGDQEGSGRFPFHDSGRIKPSGWIPPGFAVSQIKDVLEIPETA